MASNLYGLARAASEYLRTRMNAPKPPEPPPAPTLTRADQMPDKPAGQGTSAYFDKRGGRFVKRLLDVLGRARGPGRTEPPPVQPGGAAQPPQAPPPPAPPGTGPPDDDSEIPDLRPYLLGRDASYDAEDWTALQQRMTRVSSSNVYAYAFEPESRRHGILYVTFLETLPGGRRGNGPGPTYAYYDVQFRVFHLFKQATESSPGGAVWDHLRIRGSFWGHQFTYRLVHAAGDYIPRKATQRGYRTRHLPVAGMGRRTFRRSTLPEQVFFSRGGPDRGEPDRGTPDRG